MQLVGVDPGTHGALVLADTRSKKIWIKHMHIFSYATSRS
nr:MAG TPA: Poxvirus A22 protein [Caudoviricetes sp.]